MSANRSEGAVVRIPAGADDVPILNIAITTSVEAGALVRLHSDGLMMISRFPIDQIRIQGGGALPEVHRYSREEQVENWMWYTRAKPMLTVQTPEAIPAGSILEIVPGKGAGIAVAGLGWNLFVSTIDDQKDESGVLLADPVYAEFVAAAPSALIAYRKPDGSVIKVLVDADDNPVAAERVATPEGQSDTVGRLDVEWTREKRTFATVSNALPVITNAGLATPVWFGEFHWHTEFSGDGQRALADALTSARDELGLDFAGPADHMSSNGEYSRDGSPERQAEVCRGFDEPGRFVTLPGAELSGRYGHANYYARSWTSFLETVRRFPDQLHPEFHAHPFSYPLTELAGIPDTGDGIVVPHHANMDSFVSEGVVRDDGLPFWCAMHWPAPPDRAAVRLVEIVQNRGCFEAEVPDEKWGIHFGGLGGSAQTALARSYRVGFVAGTDNHTGWPTRSMGRSGYAGVTGVICDSLDTDSIFNALYDRRCYATSGARIVANASLNGHPIGSEIALAPGEPREFEITIHGTAPITDVEIVHLGFVLHRFPVDGGSRDFHASWSDTRPGRPLEDAWYYVRARQADGNRVWLSPFWIDLRDPA